MATGPLKLVSIVLLALNWCSWVIFLGGLVSSGALGNWCGLMSCLWRVTILDTVELASQLLLAPCTCSRGAGFEEIRLLACRDAAAARPGRCAFPCSCCAGCSCAHAPAHRHVRLLTEGADGEK